MTGAGWGGCIVALVPLSKVDAFIAGIKEDYYQNLEAAKGKDLNGFIFKTGPGAGAYIIDC
jgi:galactokinase